MTHISACAGVTGEREHQARDNFPIKEASDWRNIFWIGFRAEWVIRPHRTDRGKYLRRCRISLRRWACDVRIWGRLEVLIAVVMKSSIFWDITPCSPMKAYRSFGGIYHVSFSGLKSKQNKRSSTPFLFRVGFLIALLFNPEDGGDMFLRNVRWLLTDYTVLYLKR
jgi:hypothetical protein